MKRGAKERQRAAEARRNQRATAAAAARATPSAGSAAGSAAGPASGSGSGAGRPAKAKPGHKAATTVVNPFDVRQQRRKHSVLGLKVPGERGQPLKAREAGTLLRKRTLLKDYQRRNRTGSFRDKRIGEYNPNMTEEDKMMERFALERRRADRKHSRLFNLADEDGDEDDFTLTHGGKDLSQVMDDYEPSDEDMADDDLEDFDGEGGSASRKQRVIDAKTVGELHFGGFDEGAAETNGKAQRKSRKEIMEEVIQRSKMHKAMRQAQKVENEEVVDELDKDVDAVMGILMQESERAEREQRTPRTRVEEYDSLVRELATEAKARPTDRMKTLEEIAREERERLQQLEEARLQRMRGEHADFRSTSAEADADDDHVDGMGSRKKKPKSRLELIPQPDGSMKLVEHGENGTVEINDFQTQRTEIDEDGAEFRKAMRRGGLAGEAFADDDSDEALDDEEEDEEDEDDDDDESDEDEADAKGGKMQRGDDDSDGLEEEDEDELQPIPAKKRRDEQNGGSRSNHDRGVARSQKKAGADLVQLEGEEFGLEPDVQEEPADDDDEEIEEQALSDSEMEPKARPQPLARGSKSKSAPVEAELGAHLPFVFEAVKDVEALEKILGAHNAVERGIILGRLVACHHIHLGAEKRAIQERHMQVFLEYVGHVADQGVDVAAHLDHVLSPLFALMQQVPMAAVHWVRNFVSGLHAQIQMKAWQPMPKLRQLAVFQVLPAIFSSSDYWHPVITPSMIVMMQLLSQCSVSNLRCVAAGLYLCSCIYTYVQETKRLVPEAAAFLISVLSLACPPTVARRGTLPAFSLLDEQQRCSLFLKSSAHKELSPRKLAVASVSLGFKGEQAGQVKLDLLHATLELVCRFGALYRQHEAVTELFADAKYYAEALPMQSLPAETRVLVEKIASGTAFGDPTATREAMRLQAHKPVPLPSLEPEFNEDYVPRKGDAKDKTQRETQRLQYLLKKEKKAAQRELRKDARFLARVQLEEQLANDADRKERVKRFETLVSAQQGELKKLERQK